MRTGIDDAGIRRLVAAFYGRARRDSLLGPVFARAVGTTDEAWAPHLSRIEDFWSGVLLRNGRYKGDPFSAHLALPELEPAMFDRWLALFGTACIETFPPGVAAEVQARAEAIGRSLRMGLFERLPARGAGAPC